MQPEAMKAPRSHNHFLVLLASDDLASTLKEPVNVEAYQALAQRAAGD